MCIRGRVPGTGYLVPGIWYLVPGTWYLVPGTWYQVPGTKYLVQVPGTRYPVQGYQVTRYLVPKTKVFTAYRAVIEARVYFSQHIVL